MLIALEGIDGSGTTTQTPRLAEALRARGHRVFACAEPTRGPIGRMARQALHDPQPADEATLALLFAADRLDHQQRTLLPRLAEGQLVVSDRALLSSLAYQGCTLPLAWVQQINARARLPDLSLLLQVRPQVAAARRQGRQAPADRFENEARQQQVAALYERVFDLPGVGATLRVDGELDEAQVTERLLAAVLPALARAR